MTSRILTIFGPCGLLASPLQEGHSCGRRRPKSALRAQQRGFSPGRSLPSSNEELVLHGPPSENSPGAFMALSLITALSPNPPDSISTLCRSVYSSRKMVSTQFEPRSRIVNHSELRRLIGQQCRASTLPPARDPADRQAAPRASLSKNPPHHPTRHGLNHIGRVLDE